jgi:DNA-damage-inducible protein D
MKSNPFDDISHIDGDGEYWLARELAPLVSTNWATFKHSIDRVKQLLQNTKEFPQKHLLKLVVPNPSSKIGRNHLDFRLSKYGAYLVVVNLDPWDYNTANAQLYFTTKFLKQKGRDGT